MGYHHVHPEEIEPFEAPGKEFRTIGRVLGTEILGLNHVVAEPGEQIPTQYHSHDQQEELFYVIEGTLHVETPEEEYVVGEGELFVVEPEHPHRAYNPEDGEETVKVLAVGAPSVDDVQPYEG